MEKERYAPGEAVEGTVLVVEGGAAGQIEACLEYCERTRDYRRAAQTISSGVLGQGDITEGATFEFSLLLPEDPLPSLLSRRCELYWEVNVKEELPEPGPATRAKAFVFGSSDDADDLNVRDRRRIVVERPAPA